MGLKLSQKWYCGTHTENPKIDSVNWFNIAQGTCALKMSTI